MKNLVLFLLVLAPFFFASRLNAQHEVTNRASSDFQNNPESAVAFDSNRISEYKDYFSNCMYRIQKTSGKTSGSRDFKLKGSKFFISWINDEESSKIEVIEDRQVTKDSSWVTISTIFPKTSMATSFFKVTNNHNLTHYEPLITYYPEEAIGIAHSSFEKGLFLIQNKKHKKR